MIYKDTDFSFVILCPERNMGGLRGTSRSITRCYPDRPQICITEIDAKPQEIKEMKVYCPNTYKGKNTITSLLNTGLKKANTDWVIFVFSGTYVKARFYHKFAYFLKNEKDILFPIVDGKTNFYECSMNGIMMHRNVLKNIGEFGEDASLEACRLLWGAKAIEKGYQFKALMGARIV